MNKNLTFKDTINGVEGVFIHLTDHRGEPLDYDWMTELVEDINIPNTILMCKPRTVLSGPAIDRLNAFEQLGMEPEVIKDLIDPVDKAWRDMLVKQNDELCDELRKARELLDEKDREIKKLQLEVEGDQRFFTLKNKAITKRDTKILKLEAEIKELTNKCENYKDVISKKDAELQRALYMFTRNPYINDGFNTGKTSVWAKQISDNNEKLKFENSKLKDKLKKAESHITTWRERADETWFKCHTEIDSLEARNKDLMKMNDEYYDRINKLTIKEYDLHKQIDKLTEENKKLSNENALLNGLCYTSPNSKINDKLDILETANESLKRDLKDLRDENESLRSQIDGLKEVRFVLDEEIKELRNNLTTMKLKHKLNEEFGIYKLVDALKTENKDLRAKMDAINILSGCISDFSERSE